MFDPDEDDSEFAARDFLVALALGLLEGTNAWDDCDVSSLSLDDLADFVSTGLAARGCRIKLVVRHKDYDGRRLVLERELLRKDQLDQVAEGSLRPYVPCAGDGEDECKDCPGFGWFNEGFETLAGEPPWFELERCDKCKKYRGDEEAAEAHFEEWKWEPTLSVEEVNHRVLLVRCPITEQGRAQYQEVVRHCAELDELDAGLAEKEKDLYKRLGLPEPSPEEDGVDLGVPLALFNDISDYEWLKMTAEPNETPYCVIGWPKGTEGAGVHVRLWQTGPFVGHKERPWVGCCYEGATKLYIDSNPTADPVSLARKIIAWWSTYSAHR